MAVNTEVGGYKEDLTNQDPKKMVEQTKARLTASSDWLRANFWDEFTDAWQSFKCRTTPIYKRSASGEFARDEKGEKIEDLTRTNVAMPDFFIAIRKKASRKSRRPPNIRVRAKDPGISEWLSHWTALQWDRANEQQHQRRHVLQGDIFGISLKCHWWNAISKNRNFRYEVDAILDKLYAKYDEETQLYSVSQTKEKDYQLVGQMDPDMKAAIGLQLGPETQFAQEIKRFEGPVSSLPFIGDWYPEPELDTVQNSAWHIFEDVKDAEWLAYWSRQKYKDPETGEERPVFREKGDNGQQSALEELEESGPYSLNLKDVGSDLRHRLRDVIFKSRPDYEARLIPGARYLVHSEYTFRKGICWVRYIGNEKVLLGEHPLPWDLDGKYPLSAYTPMEDLLTAIGDSTPRIGRYLWKLHNVNVAQRTDITTNLMKPTLLVQKDADLPQEVCETGLFRILFVEDPRQFGKNIFEGIRVPPEAYQNGAEIVRLLQQLEPQLIDFGEQSQAVPDSRKVATLGLLQQKSQDALSSDELEALNQSVADETEIKILMLQHMMQTADVPLANAGIEKMPESIWSIQGGGGERHPRKTINTPYELQTDFEVEPEMASTLALDDEFHRQQAKDLLQLAASMPTIINIRKAAEKLLSTYAGIQAQDFIMPEPQPAPPPPPELKMSLSMKWETLEESDKAQARKALGFEPPPDAIVKQLFETVHAGAQAAQSAASAMAPPEEPAPANGKRGKKR